MSALRNTVLAATAFLLMACALGIVLLTEQDERLLPGVQLPTSRDAPMIERDGPSIVAFLDSHGVLYMRGAEMQGVELSLRQFSRLVQGKAERIGPFTVYIAADRRLPFDAVWAVVRICQSHGQWAYAFFVAEAPDQRGIRYFDFNTALSDVQSPTPNVVIALTRDAVSVNGRSTSFAEISGDIASVGEFFPRSTTRVTLRISSGLAYSNVVAVMAACNREGLRHIQIEEMESSHQDASNVPPATVPPVSSDVR